MNPEQRTRAADLAQGIALANLLFLVSLFVLAVVSIRLGMGVASWVLFLAVLPWGIGMWFLSSSRGLAVEILGWSLGINVMALEVAWFMYDYSWDGLWYHQEAILRLAEGWDPVKGDAVNYGSRNLWGVAIWLNHYPKASWLIGASVFKGLGAIEPGKFLNFTLMTAAGCQVAATLLRLTSIRTGFVVALAVLAALNPVAVGELSSFTVDGAVSSLLTILIAGCVIYAARPGLPVAAALMAVVCLLINVKFTGLVYAVILSGFGVTACLCLRRWRAGICLAAALGMVGLLSLVALGYSPYVRNYTEEGELFYPIRGKNPLDIMTPIRPVNLTAKDRVSRFVVANFSRCEQVRPPLASRLKFPLMIFPSEFLVWRTNDPEAGGFGPWFGALLLCAVAGVGLLALDAKTRRVAAICGVVTACILATVFVHTEGWLARYAPQAWMIPIVWIVGLMEVAIPSRRLLGRVMFGMMTANILFILAAWSGWNVLYGWRMHKSLREMGAVNPPVLVEFGQFQALRERLREAGILFEVVNPPPAPPNTTRRRIPTNGEQAYWYQPMPGPAGMPGK